MTPRPVIAALVLAFASAALAQPAAAPPSGSPEAGENLFYDRCAICHVAEGGGQGPSLKGLYGRKAGSMPGFTYSEALKASGLNWTGPDLNRFLTNPGLAVPGTAMPILVPDAKARADLISYFAAHP